MNLCCSMIISEWLAKPLPATFASTFPIQMSFIMMPRIHFLSNFSCHADLALECFMHREVCNYKKYRNISDDLDLHYRLLSPDFVFR
jgi:hypothetical protein